MNIYTTELTDGITVIDGFGALTPGSASTTLSTAVSSGAVLEVAATTNFQHGCSIVVDQGGANEEFFIVSGFIVSPIRMVVFPVIAVSHGIGESVTLIQEIKAGQDRTHLVNGHLDQSLELDAPVNMFSYIIDSNVTNEVDGWAVVLKNFRSIPFDTGQTLGMSSMTSTGAVNQFITIATQTILSNEFGNGFAIAMQTRAAFALEFLLLALVGTKTATVPQLAQIYLLNKHTLSHSWEIADQERLPHGASIMESRSGKTFVQSHTNNARRDFTKQFKALRQTDVDTIREIYRLSDGARRPFIADFAATEVVSNLLLLRFANENAIQINQTHFDQFDVTMQLQTIKQEDDR